MCDIIIPVWNQLEITRNCIDSIRKNTQYPYRLVIIDNASDKKTRGYLENLKINPGTNITLLRNNTNVGFIKAVNSGIKLSTAEYICILNNDTLVTYGWLKEMVNVFNKDPRIGIVNPSSNTLGQKLPAGVTPDEFAKRSKEATGLSVELGNAFGFCMFAERKLFDEIGLFDEIYGMGNFEDTDLSLRAKEKGYKTVRAIGSYVYHKEQRSFNLRKHFKRDFERNKKIFESKWGKTKRIVAIIGSINSSSLDQLKKIVKKHTQENSWVYVISPSFDTKEFFENFSNLTFYHLRILFYISAFLKIMFKQKKPNVIYGDNAFFLNLLAISKICQNAKIYKMGTI